MYFSFGVVVCASLTGASVVFVTQHTELQQMAEVRSQQVEQLREEIRRKVL